MASWDSWVFIILAARRPRGSAPFFFTELWINKFSSFLKAALLEELEKPLLTVCVPSMWSGLPHFWCSAELLGHARVFHFSGFYAQQKRICKRWGKAALGILSPLKSTFIYAITVPVMPLCGAEFLYCKASKPNLENNDYIVHVSTRLEFHSPGTSNGL